MEGEVGEQVARVVATVLQQRRPFVGEEIGVFATLEQAFDEPLPLVGITAGEKLRRLFRRGQGAGDVERHAAQKDGVVTLGRYRNAEPRQVLEDQLVDEVSRSGHRRRCTGRHGEGCHAHQALVAHHHRGQARHLLHVDRAIGLDLHAGRIVGLIDGQPRHVTTAAVAVSRRHGQPLRGSLGDARRRRLDDERHDARLVGGGRQGTLRDPPAERLILGGCRVEPAAAAVRDPGRGLEQEEALVGRRHGNPSAAGLADDVFVVLGRFETQHGETKSVLTESRLGVARTGVAARLREHGHDVVHETRGGPGDGYGRRCIGAGARCLREEGDGHRPYRHTAGERTRHGTVPLAPIGIGGRPTWDSVRTLRRASGVGNGSAFVVGCEEAIASGRWAAVRSEMPH